MDVKEFLGSPFNLNEKQLEKVLETYRSMSEEERLGQLFFLVGRGYDEKYLKHVVSDLHIGGMMTRPLPSEEVRKQLLFASSFSKVPLLYAANLENGGIGAASDFVKYASNMMVAATSNPENAYRLGKISCQEGKAVGVNFAFAPVSDIDLNFRNPITNTRTFGKDASLVADCASEYLRASLMEHCLASVKHFPGDGVDERDQHLVSSVNSLSAEEWEKTYGAIYRRLIKEGAKAFMVGHILLPDYQKKINPSLEDKDLLPASLSQELMQGLLRQRLGFKGLIVTDATTMAGFNIPLERRLSVPLAIEHGADMFLFAKNLEEDWNYMKEGYKNGLLSEKRLEEAVLRILAAKASIGLLEEDYVPSFPSFDRDLHEKWAKEVAYDSITVIKEEKGVLPLKSQNRPRILLHLLEGGANALGYTRSEIGESFKKELEKKGFQATLFVSKGGYEGLQEAYKDTLDRYDAIIYLANLATKSNQTTVRIEWTNPMGVNVPIFIPKIPTIFISVENPYHLLDVPRVRTYINCYGNNAYSAKALVDLLTGEFKAHGKDPVDSFCGEWDTRL